MVLRAIVNPVEFSFHTSNSAPFRLKRRELVSDVSTMDRLQYRMYIQYIFPEA